MRSICAVVWKLLFWPITIKGWNMRYHMKNYQLIRSHISDVAEWNMLVLLFAVPLPILGSCKIETKAKFLYDSLSFQRRGPAKRRWYHIVGTVYFLIITPLSFHRAFDQNGTHVNFSKVLRKICNNCCYNEKFLFKCV